MIVLDGSKEPKGESGIVHSLKAKPPYALLPYSEANLRVFASLRDRPDDLQALTPRCLVYRLDGMINSGDSAERWHAPGSTAAGGGFKSV